MSGQVGSKERECVAMLHGFAGTAHAFDDVSALLPPERYRALALDLPGHGSRSEERPVDVERCVELVLACTPPRFVLCGYSQGGRIALQAALAAPARVSRLVLVSSTAGIEDDQELRRRRRSDDELAQRIEDEPFEDFVSGWRRQPLFADEPERVRVAASADHRRNAPAGLAAALRGIGAGRIPPVWDRLGELEMPAAVLAGARDAKYRELARQLATSLPQGELRVVAGGHGLLLENPKAVAAAIAGEPASPLDEPV